MNNLQEFKNWLEKRLLNPETIRVKLWGIRMYGKRELTSENIIVFLKENLTKYQPSSWKAICNALAFYARFQKVEIEWELINRLIPKLQNKFYPTINKEQLEQLKSVEMRNSKKTNERDCLILDFLFYTGIRVNELTKIRHCDYQNNSLRILGKGNKIRYLPLPPFLIQHFNSNSSDYFFQTKNGKKLSGDQVRIMIYLRNKKAGLDKHISPHTFRRSFATLLNNKEIKLTTIQKLLGHSDINTTTAYIHNSYEEIYKDYSKLWINNPVQV